MITRITRGRLAPNSEHRVFELLRAAAAERPTVPGLHSMSISRTIDGRHTVLVVVTIWTDVAAMSAVLGSTWHEPSWLPGIGEYVVEASVEILETIETSGAEAAAVGWSG